MHWVFSNITMGNFLDFELKIANVLKSGTPKIGSEGAVPLLFIKRSDVGVALIFF